MLDYEKLNVYLNPFYEISREEAYSMIESEVDINKIREKLLKGNYAIQFIGKKGRGKSIHLASIKEFFPNEEYYYIKTYFQKQSFKEEKVYFIDEMQRLSLRKIFKVLKEKKSYVIGSHRNHSLEFKKAGLDYDIIKLKGLDYESLKEIIQKRIDNAKIKKDINKPKLDEEKVKMYYNKYKDNIRGILSDLYDEFCIKAK